MTRIAIITDAWYPQVSGVVRTLDSVTKELIKMGYQVKIFHPGMYRNFPCPGYKEIRIALFPFRELKRDLSYFNPHAIHISTESPLGIIARQWCLENKKKFTSSYHTMWEDYVKNRFHIPKVFTRQFLKWFHSKSQSVLVTTDSMCKEMESHGYKNLVVWSRGVDVNEFYPSKMNNIPDFIIEKDLPVLLYVGRVSKDKGLIDFFNIKIPSHKIVVGDGPEKEFYEKTYPHIHFVGYKFGDELAQWYSLADVFVFPSRTDTFGLVMLEAMACGTPVAAYPVRGPIDVVRDGVSGVLNEDLSFSVMKCFNLDRTKCREYAKIFSWKSLAIKFADYMEINPIN